MATMVATNGIIDRLNPVSIQEKGSRPKRKFRADPPVPDISEFCLAESLFLQFEHFPKEPLCGPELERHVSLCETCRTLASSLKEVMDLQDRCTIDWSGMTESQLQELLLSDLDALYKNAVRTITSYGYKESASVNALLVTGCFYVCKDPVANIMEHALKYLASGEAVDASERENTIDDLKRLQKKLLEEMVNLLRQKRPLFSRGDAMWCLLIYDMNLSLACGEDTDITSHLRHDEALIVPSAQSDTQLNSSISVVPDSHITVSDKPNFPSDCQNKPSRSGDLTLPFMKFSASDDLHSKVATSNHIGENTISLSKSPLVESISFSMPKASVLQHKPNSIRRGLAGCSHSRYRSYHSGRNYRVRGARSSSRAIRNSSLGNLLFDKRNKSISAFASMSSKTSSMEIDKTFGLRLSQADINGSFLFTAGGTAAAYDVSSCKSSLPSANGNAYFSLNTASKNNVALIDSHTNKTATDGTFSELPYYQDDEKLFTEDMKEEILLKLVLCVRRMQNQIQDWIDWAQQKVMQAARRLNKDKVELQTLRQEKTESLRLRKEKQTMEESTMKKVSNMQNAWSKACVQIERANAAMARLELENNKLRQELEGARLRATDLATGCRDASIREITTLKKIQSWEREKAILNDELTTEKHKLLQLQKQLEQAKDVHSQNEDKLIQEEKAKEEAILQVDAERKRKKIIEASTKIEEDSLASKSKNDLQTYKDDIKRLENQIAELRLSDCTKLAPLRWQTKSQPYVIGNHEYVNGDILRERECVMCLSEEMSVVFLPCSHQVVCTKCNELHEKQGMKDCPSCRTPIQRRICVRSALS